MSVTLQNCKKMWKKWTIVSASGVCYRTTRAPPRGEGLAAVPSTRWLVGWGVGSGGKTRPVWTLSAAQRRLASCASWMPSQEHPNCSVSQTLETPSLAATFRGLA